MCYTICMTSKQDTKTKDLSAVRAFARHLGPAALWSSEKQEENKMKLTDSQTEPTPSLSPSGQGLNQKNRRIKMKIKSTVVPLTTVTPIRPSDIGLLWGASPLPKGMKIIGKAGWRGLVASSDVTNRVWLLAGGAISSLALQRPVKK